MKTTNIIFSFVIGNPIYLLICIFKHNFKNSLFVHVILTYGIFLNIILLFALGIRPMLIISGFCYIFIGFYLRGWICFLSLLIPNMDYVYAILSTIDRNKKIDYCIVITVWILIIIRLSLPISILFELFYFRFTKIGTIHYENKFCNKFTLIGSCQSMISIWLIIFLMWKIN